MATKLSWRTLRLRPSSSLTVAPFRTSSRQLSSRSTARLAPSYPSLCLGPVSSRQASTSTAARPADEPDEYTETDENIAPATQPFTSLEGVISRQTLEAVTVRPFKLTHMTPVQEAVLPLLPQLTEPFNPATPAADRRNAPPRDLLVKARTGTGKTLAFLIPAIEARLKAIEAHGKQAAIDAGSPGDMQIENKAKRIYAKTRVGTLIISPTRELATQIATEAVKLTHHHNGFEVRLLVGGESKRQQLRDWYRGRPDIVVTTPGRMRDMLTNEQEILESVGFAQQLVLDEADTLLDMGFRDDIDAIVEHLPKAPERQTFLFSATVSTAIRQIARSTLDANHLFINTVSDSASPVHAHVPQYHTVLSSAEEQLPHILRLLAQDQLTNPGKSKVLVFLPTTKMTQLYSTFLRQLSKSVLPSGHGSKIYEIHSKKAQNARSNTSDLFRRDTSGASVLVTSDVSARGVDYPGVTRVIQVGIPGSAEQYVHRVGRTGRAGTGGRGDLVLLPWEVGFLSWQLQNIPLKPVTTNELKKQVTELAEAFDADPQSFFKGVQQPPARGIRRPSGPVGFKGPVVPMLNDMEKEITQLLSLVDEEAVRETFTSLLGYYISKAPELRCQKGVIVEGLRDWTIKAGGLVRAPFVSEQFLAKLGFNDNRTKRFGQDYSRSSDRSDRRNSSWDGRGRQSSREGNDSRPSSNYRRPFGDDNLGGRDPVSNPEQYKSERYGARNSFRPPPSSGGRPKFGMREPSEGGRSFERSEGRDRSENRDRRSWGERDQ